MKKIYSKIFLLFFLVNSSFLISQSNLVPNPSFETYTNCPNNIGQANYALGWSSFSNTPDYFNLCGTSGFSVPLNAFGYQLPANGNSYCGLLNYMSKALFPGNDYREYLGIALSSNLTIGTKYYVSFKVALTINSLIPSNCASSKIGALFSTVPFSSSNPAPTNNLPKIHSTSIISDTLNWTKVFGSFVADSIYQYIIIGNFFKNTNTDTLILNGDPYCSSYYYVDDICLSTDSTYTSNYSTGIYAKENSFKNLLLYPNPFTSELNINFQGIDNPYQTTIYNSTGEVIFSKEFSNNNIILDVSKIPYGIILIKITCANEYKIYKLLKQ